jgi:membrane-associated phospholipid phosphatase
VPSADAGDAATAGSPVDPVGWPVRRQDWIRAGIVCVIGVLVVTPLGLLLDGPWARTAPGRWDLAVSEALAEDRSPTVALLARLATLPTEWFTLVAVSWVLAFVWWRRFGRWDEWLLASGSLMLENTIYLSASVLVGRDRPPVEVVGAVPFTDSFPSGHAAAAVAFYGGLWLVVHRRTRSRWVDTVGLMATLAIIAGVCWSRVALGLHYPTDVAVGAGVGLAALLTVRPAVRLPARPFSRRRPGTPPRPAPATGRRHRRS